MDPVASRAEQLETLLPYVVDNHDRIKADEARLRAARERAREALGDWFPTLSQTANQGYEFQNNESSADSKTAFSEYDVSLTQLLWDFGSSNAAVDKARLQVEEARYTLQDTRLTLMTEAITAFMNVIRDSATLEFARQSEGNILEQTGLEEALVGLGSGFSTDVLQAKSQLAGAQARRVQNEGSLTNSLNRYKAVFGRMPDDIDALEPVSYPAPFLPSSLEQALDIAMATNPALKNAILAADIAREDVKVARADNFFPVFEATAEKKFKRNVGGTLGSEQETLAKVEMTWDFNVGFTAINTLEAAKGDLSASTYTAADTRRNIEEQVRNAWQQLESASLTASHLNNQANIEASFLELARNERQLGSRTLKEVLDSEVTLINAQSDALSAETDVIIAAYSLLAATGQLNYNVLKRSRGIKPPTIRPDGQPTVEPAAQGQQGRVKDDIAPASEGRSTSDLLAMLNDAEQAPREIAAVPRGPVQTATADHDDNIEGGSGGTLGDRRTDDDFLSINPYSVDREDEAKQQPQLASGDPVSDFPSVADRTLPPNADTIALIPLPEPDTTISSVPSIAEVIPATEPVDTAQPAPANDDIAQIDDFDNEEQVELVDAQVLDDVRETAEIDASAAPAQTPEEALPEVVQKILDVFSAKSETSRSIDEVAAAATGDVEGVDAVEIEAAEHAGAISATDVFAAVKEVYENSADTRSVTAADDLEETTAATVFADDPWTEDDQVAEADIDNRDDSPPPQPDPPHVATLKKDEMAAVIAEISDAGAETERNSTAIEVATRHEVADFEPAPAPEIISADTEPESDFFSSLIEVLENGAKDFEAAEPSHLSATVEATAREETTVQRTDQPVETAALPSPTFDDSSDIAARGNPATVSPDIGSGEAVLSYIYTFFNDAHERLEAEKTQSEQSIESTPVPPASDDTAQDLDEPEAWESGADDVPTIVMALRDLFSDASSTASGDEAQPAPAVQQQFAFLDNTDDRD